MRMPEVYWRALSGHPLVEKRKRNRSEQKGKSVLWYNHKKASDEPVEHAEMGWPFGVINNLSQRSSLYVPASTSNWR